MPFFDNLSKKIGETAQSATKKTSELIEVNKLNSSIHEEEEKIEKLLLDIGKRIYDKYNQNTEEPSDYLDICGEIDVHYESIKVMKFKIAEIKGLNVQ